MTRSEERRNVPLSIVWEVEPGWALLDLLRVRRRPTSTRLVLALERSTVRLPRTMLLSVLLLRTVSATCWVVG